MRSLQLMAMWSLMAGCATTTSGAKPEAGASDPASQTTAQPSSQGFDAAVAAGDEAWASGQLDRAVYQYVLALQQHPDDGGIFAKIGAIEEGRGNMARARKAFEMAHHAQPEEPRIAERLGRLYLQLGEVDKASDVYVHVLAVHPKRARALDGMGEVFRLRGKLAGAILCFDQALQADDVDVAEVRTHRGYAKLLAGDIAGARDDLRAALAQRVLPETWFRLGELQARQRDIAGALKSLSNVMDISQAYNQVGLNLLKIKEYRAAVECFTRAINTSPSWFEDANKNLTLANEYLKRTAGPG